jgi:4-hydroxybenzoate polyprenyltransferase
VAMEPTAHPQIGSQPELRGDSNGAELPLCVDLDGTLIQTDTLVESLVELMRQWRVVISLPYWLLGGKARLKRELAERARLDYAHLPYRSELVTYLREQKSRGRYIVLATAANQSIADGVAAHLGIFDEILASNETINLRGETKARALCSRFGERQFSYAGNAHSDLPVWRAAGAAVLVATSRSISHLAQQSTNVEHRIGRSGSRLKALLNALRPYQWSKNVLVFVPILTSGALWDLRGWTSAGLIFAAFCLVASALYLVNDLTDLAADRRHLRKRSRPLASGAMPLLVSLGLVPVLLLLGGAAAFASGAPLFILLYALLSLSYSLKLKEMPLIDLFTLAGLYTLRLFAGGQATGHPVSSWLLAFSSFLFLSLVIIKRVAELSGKRREGSSGLARRAYVADDLGLLQAMGIGASFASSVVLALYVQSDVILGLHYTRPLRLWAIVPLMLFWQCRMWLSTARGYMRDDPIVYAARDWVSQLIGIALVATMLLAR